MPDTKALFFDLDGTLLNAAGEIPASAVEAIHAAQKNGHRMFLNTGRPYCNVPRAAKALGLDGYVCGCGTTVLYHGRILYQKRQPRSLCREMALQLRAYGMQPIYEAHEHMYFDLTRADAPHLRRIKDWCASSGAPIGPLEAEDFHFDKISAMREPDCQWETAKAYIAAKGFLVMDITPTILEAIPQDVTKATGMAYVLDALGLPPEASYAFGDSVNDLPMLAAAGHAVAMGGSEALYGLVEYVTTPLDEDGIANALRHYGML